MLTLWMYSSISENVFIQDKAAATFTVTTLQFSVEIQEFHVRSKETESGLVYKKNLVTSVLISTC